MIYPILMNAIHYFTFLGFALFSPIVQTTPEVVLLEMGTGAGGSTWKGIEFVNLIK